MFAENSATGFLEPFKAMRLVEVWGSLDFGFNNSHLIIGVVIAQGYKKRGNVTGHYGQKNKSTHCSGASLSLFHFKTFHL